MMSSYFRQSLHNSDNNQALEGDIMKFFAIICLCLMVIFSLVQSMPMQQDDTINHPELVSIEILENKLSELNDKINVLTQRNKVLSNILEGYRQKEKNDNFEYGRTEQKLNQALTELEETKLELNRLQDQLKQSKKDKQNLTQELIKADAKLQTLQAQYEKAWVKTEASQEIQEHYRNLAKNKDYKNNPDTGSSFDSLKTEPTRQIKITYEQTPRKGFSLTFSSDTGLLELIKSNRIDYFLLSGKQAFQYQWSGKSWQLKAVSVQKQMYMMHENTVPVLLRETANKQIFAVSSQSMQFGVVLPQPMVKQINQLMVKNRGGAIVISSAGAVEIKNAY